MKNKGDWLLLLAAFIGGGGFISLKYLLDWGYDPFQVIFGRFLMASLCMCVVYHRRLKKITKREWKVGGMLGALLAAMFLLMTVGLQYTTPSVNAFLVNIPAVIVPFICWGVFKQKPTKNHFLAAFMTLIGVCCLSLTSDFRIDLGAALSLLAAVAFSLQMAFAHCSDGKYCNTGGDDSHCDFYRLGYACADPAFSGEFLLPRGILHSGVFCSAVHRSADHFSQ